MSAILPGLVVTGASGFIGRYFVFEAANHFRLFCIARRTQEESKIPNHPNIRWIQADVSKWRDLVNTRDYILRNNGVDYVLHLAGYYDFTLKDNPAYENTNVKGTENILEMCRQLDIRRFMFSSSLAACKFPPKGRTINEESPPDADIPYARSKLKGEAEIREYAAFFPCTIIRLAAVFSDWCEYPPMYTLLKKWLSRNPLMTNAIAGKGESALPYIHINDLIKMFLRVIEISDALPRFQTLIASPQGCVSHLELYNAAKKYYFSNVPEPYFVPKPVAAVFLVLQLLYGKIVNKLPFERPWMAKYIDQRLCVDANETFRAIGWRPTPRYQILRRMLFLTETGKRNGTIGFIGMSPRSTAWQHGKASFCLRP